MQKQTKWHYAFSDSEADFDVVNALSRVAKRLGLSNAQVAYSWLLHKGVTAPIIGASKLVQLGMHRRSERSPPCAATDESATCALERCRSRLATRERALYDIEIRFGIENGETPFRLFLHQKWRNCFSMYPDRQVCDCQPESREPGAPGNQTDSLRDPCKAGSISRSSSR